MTERPILFSGPMVRAILDGGKSQTRRILKPQPVQSDIWWHWHGGAWPKGRAPMLVPAHSMWNALPARPGDVLWVREKLQFFGEPGGLARLMHEPLHYAADESPPGTPGPAITTFPDDWRLPRRSGEYIPSIHMPRWASRITLRVTKVRLHQLQEISEEDAMAEGARPAFTRTTISDWPVSSTPSYRWGFEELWASIHGPGAWEANPWVAAVSFERVRP